MCILRSLSLANGLCFLLIYSQEEEYSSVGHGIGQSQDPTAHDSITQVEDRHAKGRLSFKLMEKTKAYNKYRTFENHNVLSVVLNQRSLANTYVCEARWFLSISTGQKLFIFQSYIRIIKSTVGKRWSVK